MNQNNHLQLALDEIDQRLTRLQTARDALAELVGIASPPPIKTLRNDNGEHAPAPKKRKSIGERIGRAMSASRMAAVAPIRGLSEPFTTDDVMRACKISERHKAANIIFGFKTKGWLSSPSQGRFVRTKTFGGDRPGDALLRDIHAEIDAEKKKDE